MPEDYAIDHFVTVKKKQPILRLWEVPSFDDMVSWTIYVDSRGIQKYHHPMIRRVTRPAFAVFPSGDCLKAMQAETLSNRVEVQERHLRPDEFTRLDIFRQFTFRPVFTEDWGGHDGSYFGLQTWSYPTSVVLEWWEAEPSEWREIIDWAAQTREYINHLLDDQDDVLKDINQRFAPDTKIWRYVE